MTQKICTLLTFLFSISCVFGQQSWIIQLKNGFSVKDFESHWQKNFRSSSKPSLRNIGPHFNIFEFTTDVSVSKRALLENQSVLFAEKNAPLEIRASPNDPLVSQQWHLERIGAQKAWDQTTGGLTFNKDTIVMGIIDLGFLTTHEDLKNRLWRNKEEIAGNGKDDDANGYTDDVFGLSLRYKNEKHSTDNATDGLKNHGTSVAGLMSGEGNNKLGITGIMWNCKLMLGTFSANANIGDLIEIFNYMLDQRLRYNQSNGKQGALIVTINYSGGISFAKAEDYPIWCGMYDKMGAAGILNCGATTNRYVDVDEEGDMPSTCPSEFLIAVTNTDRADKRIYNAGFGLQHIDLGSPGEGVQSSHSDGNSAYTSFSGTSAATPIVAGAVGLLYSYPGKEWADFIRNAPADAARIVKKAILASVDKNADLTGKSVSGGRLNLSRAMDTLKKYVTNRVITATKDEITIRSISPNPASDNLQIQIDSNHTGQFQLTIFDVMGRQILNTSSFINLQYSLKLPDMANGTYLLKLSNESGSITKKFIVYK